MSQALKATRRLPPPNDEERWLAAVLQLLDCGLAQIARNMIWHRLVYRHGATETEEARAGRCDATLHLVEPSFDTEAGRA